MRYFH